MILSHSLRLEVSHSLPLSYRKDYFAKHRVFSIWSEINSQSERFTNHMFAPSEQATVLSPSTLSKNIKCVPTRENSVCVQAVPTNLPCRMLRIAGSGKATSVAGTRPSSLLSLLSNVTDSVFLSRKTIILLWLHIM